MNRILFVVAIIAASLLSVRPAFAASEVKPETAPLAYVVQAPPPAPTAAINPFCVRNLAWLFYNAGGYIVGTWVTFPVSPYSAPSIAKGLGLEYTGQDALAKHLTENMGAEEIGNNNGTSTMRLNLKKFENEPCNKDDHNNFPPTVDKGTLTLRAGKLSSVPAQFSLEQRLLGAIALIAGILGGLIGQHLLRKRQTA